APDALGCAAAAPGRSSIMLRDNASALADRIVWRWRGAVAVDKGALGFPGSFTGYALCVFDRTGLKLSASAPAGGLCGGRPCWHELPSGYRYADVDGTPDGIQHLQMHAGPPGQSRLMLRGRGPLLAMPSSLGLAPPVTVRLQRTDGAACWQSVYA